MPSVPSPKLPVAPPRAAVPAPVKPRAAAPAAATPRPPSGPTSAPRSAPATAAAPVSTPAATGHAGPANIPIAIPIPFTAASSPTPGMLERIKAAAGSSSAVAGLDPAVASALLQLSTELVEQIVWEVVPELAEQMIKEKMR